MIRTIQKYIDSGVCQKCVLLLVAQLYDMEIERVEDLWVDHQVEQLEGDPS